MRNAQDGAQQAYKAALVEAVTLVRAFARKAYLRRTGWRRGTCPRDGALHVTLWHFMPILAAAAAGTQLGNCGSPPSLRRPATRGYELPE
jgi:hypothetical protein